MILDSAHSDGAKPPPDYETSESNAGRRMIVIELCRSFKRQATPFLGVRKEMFQLADLTYRFAYAVSCNAYQ